MASEELRAVFTAVETISKTLDSVDQSIQSLQNSFSGLDASMASNTVSSQAQESQIQDAQRAMSRFDNQIEDAQRSLSALTGQQFVNVSSAATMAGSTQLAAKALDNMGEEALESGGQLKFLETVMDELALSGSALSLNIGAFNVSLRNLAPLIPIAASMGTAVTIFGALAANIGAATVAFGALMGVGALAFAESIKKEFGLVNEEGATMQAIMGGIKDLFVEALEPLNNMENADFFVNVIEGLADLTNRLAQAIDQMRGAFMPFFTGIAEITNNEFDEIATAIQDTFIQATPVLLDFFEWFMDRLPGALRFMTDTLVTMQGPISSLGDSIFSFLQAIIDVAVHISQGLAPAFSVALDFATTLINVFETLSNGFLQATLFIGGMVFMLTKFVGIANTAANIGLSAANSFTVLADQIRNSGGVMAFFNNQLSESFRHLDALGKVLTGNMTIAQASGKRFEEVRDRLQGIAEETEDAEDAIAQLENQILSLTGTSEAMDATAENVGDAMDDIAHDAEDSTDRLQQTLGESTGAMDDVADSMGDVDGPNVDAPDLGEFGEGNADALSDTLGSISGSGDEVVDSMDNVDDSTQAALSTFENLDDSGNFRVGGQFASIGDAMDEVSDKDLINARTADSVAEASDEVLGLQSTLDQFGPAVTADEVIGGLDPDRMPDIETDDVARGLAVDDLKPKSLAQTFRDSAFDTKFQNELKSDIPSTDLRDVAIFDTDDVDTENLDKIRDKFSGLGDGIGSATSTMRDKLGTGIEAFGRFSNSVAARMNRAGSRVKDGLMTMGGAITETTQLAVTKFRTMGGVSGILSSAFGSASNSATGLATSLRTAASSAVTAGLGLLSSAAQSIAAATGYIYATFASQGLAAGLRAVGASAWGAVTALAASAAAAAMTAVSFVAGLIPASISAGTALNIAFAGIPALIGAIVVLAGLAVGVLGNLDGIASGAKSTFDGFKSAIEGIGSALLSVGVPAWNLFIDIIEMLIAPVFAIIDGFKMIGQSLGIVSDEGGGLGSIIGMMIDGFSVLMSTIGAMLDFVAPVFSFLGNLIYDAFIIPFKLVAVGIRLVIAIFKTLFNFLMENVPFVSEFVNMIVSGFDTIIDTIAAIPSAFQSAFTFAADLVDDIMSFIMDMVQPVVDTINKVIDASNSVLGTDFDKLTVEREGRDVSEALAGAQTSAEDVRDNIRSDAEEPDEDDVTTEPNVSVNLEDTVENNVEMQADPEDKAQMSRIAKDALEEANSFARRQQGGQ